VARRSPYKLALPACSWILDHPSELLQRVVSSPSWKDGPLAVELYAPFDLTSQEGQKGPRGGCKDVAKGIKSPAFENQRGIVDAFRTLALLGGSRKDLCATVTSTQ
jgi:hypothetical protein